MKKKLLNIYDRLHKRFGPRHWWPADTPFEMIVGAILTQNTAWSNVEKAITNLRRNRLLEPNSLARAKKNKLAALIRPAGYYNIKAKRLKNFLKVLSKDFNGNLKNAFKLSTKDLRKRLLSINGIGEETADCILLYAANRPIFVVDAYTKRVLSRHGIIKEEAPYEDVQALFMENLPAKNKLFNEYHALIVELGKEYCRKKPLCGRCPLKGI